MLEDFRSSRPSWQRLEPILLLRFALPAERELSGLEGSVIDFVRVHIIVAELAAGRNPYFVVGAAVPVVSRRPGASLADPNKAARRVPAVEFTNDSDDT